MIKQCVKCSTDSTKDLQENAIIRGSFNAIFSTK